MSGNAERVSTSSDLSATHGGLLPLKAQALPSCQDLDTRLVP